MECRGWYRRGREGKKCSNREKRRRIRRGEVGERKREGGKVKGKADL